MKRQIINLAVGAAALFAASSLQADTISYSLSVGNPAISGYTGPYGSVLVTLISSTQAKIEFTAASGFLFGDGGTVGVNVNANSWTLGTITGSNSDPSFTPGPFSNGGSGNEDGFGVFNQKITSFDGYGHSSDYVSFTLTDTSGTWLSAANVLIANEGGSTVAGHIFVIGVGDALSTGFAANGSQVPDGGSTVALLGCGLAGIGMISRKFRKS